MNEFKNQSSDINIYQSNYKNLTILTPFQYQKYKSLLDMIVILLTT